MFGHRLKEARKAKGLTLEELANAYNAQFEGGLNKGTISKYENGKQIPMITVARDLSLILDVSTDYLVGKTNSISKPARSNAKTDRVSNDNIIYIMDNLSIERRQIIEDLILATWKRQKDEENIPC